MLAAMKMAEPTIVLNVMRLTSQVPSARTSLGAGGGVVELRWLSWFFSAADARHYSSVFQHRVHINDAERSRLNRELPQQVRMSLPIDDEHPISGTLRRAHQVRENA